MPEWVNLNNYLTRYLARTPSSCIVLPLPCASAPRFNRKPRFPLKVSPNVPVDAAR